MNPEDLLSKNITMLRLRRGLFAFISIKLTHVVGRHK